MADEAETILLVGGTRDGERRPVRAGAPELTLPRLREVSITAAPRLEAVARSEVEVYRRRTVYFAADLTRSFFAIAALSDSEAFALLLLRYPAPPLFLDPA
jgi:hypothetical protein